MKREPTPKGFSAAEPLVRARVPDADRARFDAIMDRYSRGDAATVTPATPIGTAHGTGNGSGDRIVTVFENAESARAAREALIVEGIDRKRFRFG